MTIADTSILGKVIITVDDDTKRRKTSIHYHIHIFLYNI